MTTFPGATPHPVTGRGGFPYRAKPDGSPYPWRLVLHTTETRGLPRYTSPPHVTIHPVTGQVWQHVPFDRAAYALINVPGDGTETNAAHAIQFEIIGYARDAATMPTIHVARVAAFVFNRYPIRPYAPRSFNGGTCYGTRSPCRLTVPEWIDTNGVVGHQHVPGNRHWDPGRFPAARMIQQATQLDTGDPEMITATSPTDTVADLQRFLLDLGFNDYEGKPLKIDGDPGRRTWSAWTRALNRVEWTDADPRGPADQLVTYATTPAIARVATSAGGTLHHHWIPGQRTKT